MAYKDIKNYRHRLKERAVYVLGEKCQCCGYDKCLSALEFHHIDPDIKEFSFCENTNRSWESVRSELKKCILVCANCHREIHSNLISNLQLTSSFSEERAKEIDKLVENVKKHKIYYCSSCGIEVSKGHDYCPKCAALKKRLVSRPSREELKFLIRNKPFTQIGKQYGVSDNAIRKWCLIEDLPNKSSIIKQYTDEEWELI